MTAPTTEKVSTMAQARTTELASLALPLGSSRAVELTVRANTIPPTTNAMESVTSDHASQEAARWLIPPIPLLCTLSLQSQHHSTTPPSPQRYGNRYEEEFLKNVRLHQLPTRTWWWP